jgi:carotenoid cleavage dioxygenase
MAEQLLECNRSDLLILDTADLGAGPVATVRLPFRIFGQVHGCWVADEALPGM